MHICLFDIDGTLVNTGGAGQAAFARTLAADFGIDPMDGRVPFAGRSDRAIAMELFANHRIAPTQVNWERFRVGYLARLEESLRSRDGCLLPGVVELLTVLANRGDVALGLLTGNVREAARTKLTYFGIWDWFAFGGFGDEHLQRDDIARESLAAARAHIDGRASAPINVLVIGDTPHDIRCARAIDARSVAVPTGHSSADALSAASPDLLVDSLAEAGPILNLLDG